MSGLPGELKEFVKSIGETKSKQEEDRLVKEQLSLIRSKFLEKGLTPRKSRDLLFMVIFVEMLGFDASFAYIHAVNLTQSKSLREKRLGYLACTLFLSHSPEFLIMLVRTIQKDLESSSVHEVVMGLTTLHRLMNQTLADALLEQVLKLLHHPTDLVRKKALLVV
jgi:AP-4 complex subunit epsilon-1